jgi:hypothetical protein
VQEEVVEGEERVGFFEEALQVNDGLVYEQK